MLKNFTKLFAFVTFAIIFTSDNAYSSSRTRTPAKEQSLLSRMGTAVSSALKSAGSSARVSRHAGTTRARAGRR